MRIPQKLILLLLSFLLLSGCTAQTKPAVSPDPLPDPIAAAPAEPLTWDDVGMEGDALFPVKKDGLWGFINKDSQIVIPLQFEEVQAFSQGFAAVRQGERWGFVDRTGDMVIAPAMAGGKTRFVTTSRCPRRRWAVGLYRHRWKIGHPLSI